MISNYRFRNEGALVVLQVAEESNRSMYDTYRTASWRDAKTEDLLDVAALIRGGGQIEVGAKHREFL